MATNIFEDFDEQSQNQLAGLKMLDFEQVMGNRQSSSFQSILKNNSFEEMAYVKKNGVNNSCGEYKDEWSTKIIDINELLKFIRTNKSSKKVFYYPDFLISSLNPISSKSPAAMMLKSVYASVSGDKTVFNYEDESLMIKRNGRLEVKLNSRACYVNLDEPGYIFKIDAKKKSLYFRIAFVYEDAKQLRDYNITPDVENDFVIGDQYNAIIIKADNANTFVALADHTGSKEFVKEKIKNVFVDALKIAKTGSELKFLYENIPDFVLNQLLLLLKEEKLWNHVNLLTEYDDTGTFSSFKDSSGALMNVFKAFGNSYSIIEKFTQDQAFLKRIYQNLDGSSEFMGQVISNRIIFASMISACCVYNNRLKTTDKIFYYGKGYKIDSDISWFSDEKEDEFFLKQQKNIEHISRQPNTETDEFGVTIPLGSDLERSYSETIDQEKGKMYHPMDMVSLVDYTSGIDIPIPVPVVFVKALAGENEMQDVELAIRIGFDIVAIIAGVIIMGTTANPGVFALALADVVLATGDVAINTNRNEILQIPGGAEFLKTWEQIYVIGGIATASPMLIQSFFKAGAGLLRTANAVKNFKVVNFTRACITKVILEKNIANFTKNTVKEIFYAEEALTNVGVKFNINTVARLQENGVLFIKGVGNEGKVFGLAVLYKGEVIAQGTAKEIRDSLKDIWTVKGSGSGIVNALESLYNKTKTDFDFFLNSVPELLANRGLAEYSYSFFRNKSWNNLEKLFIEKNLNGGWPPNRGGFNIEDAVLEPGFVFDRYGGWFDEGVFYDKGNFVSPKGTGFKSRALPLNIKSKPFREYIVLKPIPKVKKGTIIPWFKQKGLGVQYELPVTISELEKNGFIKFVK